LYSKSYTSKITSGTLLALLAISGFAVLMAVPISSVRAVTTVAGSLKLSASSGIPTFNTAYMDFGTTITVTGTGFPSGQDNIQLVMLPSTATITATVAPGCDPNDHCDLAPYRASIDGSAIGVQSDANGWFMAQFDTPIVQGGNYIVYAIYPTSTGNVVTTTVPFTVTSAIYAVSDFTGTTSGGFGDPIQVSGVGFGNAENIQPIPSSFFNGAVLPITTGNAPGVNEGTFDCGPETTGCVANTAVSGVLTAGTISDLVTGSHTVTVLGLSSGDSASETFTIVPYIQFFGYNGGLCNVLTYTIQTAAGQKVCVVGHGFAKSATVAAAGSVTIGTPGANPSSTIHGEIDSDANGHFAAVPLTLGANIGVGALNVVIGGTTFNYANANVVQERADLFSALTTYEAGTLIGSTNAGGSLITLPDSGGFTQKVGSTITFIGFGYPAGTAVGAGMFQLQNPPGTNIAAMVYVGGGQANGAATADGNGGFEAAFTVPTIQHFKYTLHDTTGGGNGAPDSTFTVNPYVRLSDHSFSAGYATATGISLTLVTSGPRGGLDNAAGPSATSGDLTVYVGGNLWATKATQPDLGDGNIITASGTFGQFGAGHFTPVLPELGSNGILSTDLAWGSYQVNVTGSYKGDWSTPNFKASSPYASPTAYSTLTILPIALVGSLSINNGPAGTVVALQTGAIGSGNPGIHGLAANTQYNIMWDGTTNVGSFTSTSTGGVPVGTQFTVPAGTSGNHVVDIQTTAGVSALWGQIKSKTGVYLVGQGLPHGQFVNMVFALATSLIVTPSVANGGSVMTLSGNGLPASTLLYLTNCASGITYAQFTSTATGSVASGVTFTVPQMSNPGPETGALTNWQIVNNKGCGPGTVGVASFVYAAAMTLSSISGPAGTTITATTSGLANGFVYDIVFNYAPISTNLNAYTGQIIGVIIANAQGGGTAQITIPASAAAGAYQIGLVSTCAAPCGGGKLSASLSVLNIIPVFTVGGGCTGGSCQQFTISGSASVVTNSFGSFLQVVYTNPGTQQVTGVVIVSVQNTEGQTVFIGSSTIHPAAGQSDTALVPLLIGSGSYTASVFVITTSGGSLSAPTSGVAIKV